MQINDTYRTIQGISEGLYKEKGSKFIAQAFPVHDEDEIKTHLETVRKTYHGARHHCYAYQLGIEKVINRSNDDGEPSGTAGKPIFNQILSKDLTNILVIVTRYFGGKKLGASGLVNAYKTATRYALDNASFIERTIKDIYQVKFRYEDTNVIMKIIGEKNLQQLEQVFDIESKIIFSIRKSESDRIFKLISRNKKLEIRYLRTE